MKKRLLSIIDAVKRRKVSVMICSVMICSVMITAVTLLSVNVFASSGVPEKYIGSDKAKAIALEHAGISEESVTFIKARMDYDDGYVVYDVEFYSGNNEYDYEIDAVSGAILEYDREIEYQKRPKTSARKNNSSEHAGNTEQPAGNTEQPAGNTVQNTAQYIGEDKAKSIALSDAGLLEAQVRRLKVELDREDGIMVYEVEFTSGRIEYEYEINAIDGTIIKTDVDYD